ncbi:MAG: nucleotidyltransferase family protein [Prevotella sp.]|nr:nucleotidyltransferase family protein [Prevotella sp.]
MKQAMIFAAGLGTRLKPLTDTMPKALVRVGGEPLLWHVVMKLKRAGFERIVVNVHHFADQIEEYLNANDGFGLDIRISDERRQLLETGGGIKAARPLFDTASPILIHNVDILSNIDLSRLYDSTGDADATLLVSPRVTKRYLLFDEDMRLNGWKNIETGEQKGPCTAASPQMFAFSGIHVFSPRLFPLMDEWPERFGIIDFYLKACADSRIYGYLKDDLRLLDVGKLDSLHEAEQLVLIDN